MSAPTSTAPGAGTPYRVLTPRLLLRCLEPGDLEARLEAIESSGDHLINFFVPPPPGSPPPRELQIAHIRRFRGSFDLDQDRVHAVLDRESGRFLGEVSLLLRAGIAAREIGYWLRRDATGRGLATEMASAAARIAFELDRVKRVDLMITPNNVASARVAERLGFKLEGRLRDRQLAAHHPRGDLLSFSLLDSEYPTSPPKSVPIEAYDLIGRRLL